MLGNAFAQKSGDIGASCQLLELWQGREIEFRRDVFTLRCGRVRRFDAFAGRRVRLFGLLLALRPSRQKALIPIGFVRTAHGRPVPSSDRPPGTRGRSPLARSRLRLWNTRSTWNRSTKAAIHDAISGGIGTVPITSQPLSNIASPSVGSAVTLVSSSSAPPSWRRNATQIRGSPSARLSR